MEKSTKIFNYGNYSNFAISCVEKILTFDCFLNAFSSDQIGQLNDKAKAKYGISFTWLVNFEASSMYIEYSSYGAIFRNLNNSAQKC